MLTISEIAQKMAVKDDELKEFEVQDIFNDNNVLHGYICRRSNHLYGALYLTKVNDEECDQLIYCTPKLHYPFNDDGIYHWPRIQHIDIYNKLDGTNILSYKYIYENKVYVSYKTRLTPMLTDMGFGSFLSMWQEILSINPWINELEKINPKMNLSFEMYGSRNPITVKYDVPLEVAFLFGVDRATGAISSPNSCMLTNDVKTAQRYDCGSSREWTQIYEGFKEQMSKEIQNNNEELVVEGCVFYATCEGEKSQKMLKCKPKEIELLHWATGAIPRLAIWTTCINAYESWAEPTVENVIELLKEEFSDMQLGKSQVRIGQLFRESQLHMEMVKKVNDVWSLAKTNGFDVTKDKANTMRFMSQYFSKNDMRRVGSIVLHQAGLL